MNKITAVCPGSFDPVTYGHIDIFKRAADIFGNVVVLVMQNDSKDPVFSPEERCSLIRQCVGNDPRISVISGSGLCAKRCAEIENSVIVKGIRNLSDYEYEQTLSQANLALGSPETLFLPCSPEYSFISTSLGLSVYHLGEDASAFFPPEVLKALDHINQ